MRKPHTVQILPLPGDRLLDVKAAAEFLGVQPSTVRKWVFRRLIPSVRLSARARRFRLSDLQTLVESNLVLPSGDPSLNMGNTRGQGLVGP